MTEYQCRALSDCGKKLELLTCGAPLLSNAIDDFRVYCEDKGVEFENLVCVTFDAVESDA